MRLISSGEIFNPNNNSFIYLCRDDEGSLWLRSSAGNWAKIETSSPMGFDDVSADFDAFMQLGKIITENDIKVDNASQIVIDPSPIE